MSSGALAHLTSDAVQTLRRFPLVIGAAFVSAAAAVIAVGEASASDPLSRIAPVAALGISFLFALTVHAERRRQSVLLWQSLGVVFLLLFYVAWPGWVGPVPAIRYIQFGIGFHLLAAYLPFLMVDERQGFWQYNRILLLRFLTAGIFSVVLFFGLTIALLAIDNLLGVKIDEETYVRLWLLVALVFNTWFFLGGVPRNLRALDTRPDYPVGLKVFAQYILTPIVAIYLVILTLYLGRILITTTWPSGWIGYLVSSVAVVGILAFLLVFPIRERAENRWIRTFSRGFFVALFPSIVMLLMAIWQRIAQYGVTEKRYFVVVLALWLAGIAVYYTVRPQAHLKIIPVSLGVLAFLTAAGPWSAYAVSARSQTGRLQSLWSANELLVEGRVQPATGEVSFLDRREMSAVIRYLLENHDPTTIAPWFRGEVPALDSAGNGSDSEQRAAAIMAFLGLEYVEGWRTGEIESFSYRVEEEEEVTRIAGYDFALRGDWSGRRAFTIDGGQYVFAYDDAANTLRILRGQQPVLAVPLDDFLATVREFARRNAAEQPGIPRELMELRAEGGGFRLLIFARAVNGTVEEGRARLDFLSGDLYLVVP
jgi:hypothetical protein